MDLQKCKTDFKVLFVYFVMGSLAVTQISKSVSTNIPIK